MPVDCAFCWASLPSSTLNHRFLQRLGQELLRGHAAGTFRQFSASAYQ